MIWGKWEECVQSTLSLAIPQAYFLFAPPSRSGCTEASGRSARRLLSGRAFSLSVYPASASQLSVGGCYFARQAVSDVKALVMISGGARCGGLAAVKFRSLRGGAVC